MASPVGGGASAAAREEASSTIQAIVSSRDMGAPQGCGRVESLPMSGERGNVVAERLAIGTILLAEHGRVCSSQADGGFAAGRRYVGPSRGGRAIGASRDGGRASRRGAGASHGRPRRIGARLGRGGARGS